MYGLFSPYGGRCNQAGEAGGARGSAFGGYKGHSAKGEAISDAPPHQTGHKVGFFKLIRGRGPLFIYYNFSFALFSFYFI